MKESVKILYHKYLKGKLTADELSIFQKEMAYLSDDELWTLMQTSTPRESEQKMNPEKKEEQLQAISQHIARTRFRKILRYAAVLLVLVASVSGGFIYFNKYYSTKSQIARIVVAPGNKAHIVLPDGTKVSLNSNTELTYDIREGDHRNVRIVKGEAFFDVTKDPDNPFIVSVGEMNITVLGTKFNVNANGDKIETSLFTGSVRLSVEDSNYEGYLVPGKKSIYEEKNHKMTITDNNPSLDAGWKDGYLVFYSAPLKTVLKQIENWYGVKITLQNKKLASDLITGSFHNETLESVLQSLSMQYNFEIEHVKNEIIIRDHTRPLKMDSIKK